MYTHISTTYQYNCTSPTLVRVCACRCAVVATRGLGVLCDRDQGSFEKQIWHCRVLLQKRPDNSSRLRIDCLVVWICRLDSIYTCTYSMYTCIYIYIYIYIHIDCGSSVKVKHSFVRESSNIQVIEYLWPLIQIWWPCGGRGDFWPSILIFFGLGRT